MDGKEFERELKKKSLNIQDFIHRLSKQNRKKVLIIALLCVIALLILITIIRVVAGFAGKKVDTSEGLAIIEAAESADITTIETKIENLESQSDDGTEKSLKETFASTVVMGDSITEGFAEYDILNSSSVIAEIGVELTDLDEAVEKLVEVNPQIVFLTYGLNDILALGDDTDTFTEEYQALIEKIGEELPDTKIFVNSIFPVQSSVLESEPLYSNIDAYNEALVTLCDKLQIAYVDNTALVTDTYYESDGIHFKSDFYTIWAQNMAEVAEL